MMDVIALVLAAAAAAVFLYRRQFGLALLTVALICQFTHLGGHNV